MIYHRRNKSKINKKALIIAIILLCLLIFGSLTKNLVHLVAVPVITVKNGIAYPFQKILEQFRTKQNLINQNEELLKENRRLEIENLTIDSLKRENESLRNIVNYVENFSEYKLAKVLNQPPFSPYDTFLINLGSGNVVVGDAVYYLGAFIGIIEEVYSQTAVVRLRSSPGQTFFVSVADQETEATGIGGGGFVLSLPKDFKIEENQVVFVGQKPIGTVDKIESDETDAFKKIYFRYPFNVNEIDFVEVLKSNQ